MEKNHMEEYLYENIPLTKLMGIRLYEFNDKEVILKTPLGINRNHKGTAFGGSLATVVTTACWLMAYKHFKDLDKDCHIVIGRSSVDYKLPVTEEFYCSCRIDDFEALEKSKEYFIKKGKTKIELNAYIEEKGKRAVEFTGIFYIFR